MEGYLAQPRQEGWGTVCPASLVLTQNDVIDFVDPSLEVSPSLWSG